MNFKWAVHVCSSTNKLVYTDFRKNKEETEGKTHNFFTASQVSHSKGKHSTIFNCIFKTNMPKDMKEVDFKTWSRSHLTS